jgi:hypothetical protein
MAPFHEFECTGDDNEFVQDIDRTEEARKAFNEETTLRYKDPQGTLHYTYDDEFYRDPTPEEEKELGPLRGTGGNGKISWTSNDWKDGRGYRTRIHFLPEGWTEVRVNQNTVKTFAEFIEDWFGHETVKPGEEIDLTEKHKYGYCLVDENGDVIKTVDRTNPNKKWDWYQIGGRWNGFFKMKPFGIGVLGTPSSLSSFDSNYKPPTADRADAAMKADIDIEGMRDEAGKEAGKRYDLFTKVTDGCPRHRSWQEVQVECRTGETDEDGIPKVDWGKAREIYGDQPTVKALRNNKETIWFEADDFLVTREEYVQDSRPSRSSRTDNGTSAARWAGSLWCATRRTATSGTSSSRS